MSVSLSEILLQVLGSLKLNLLLFFVATAMEHLRKEGPAGAVARKMVEAHIPRHRFEPTARRRAIAQFGKPLIGLEEHFLGNIFGLALVGEQTHGGAKYHVLVVAHERLELFCVCHRWAATAGRAC